MAIATKGTNAKILVDEFDFSGDTAGFEMALTNNEEESTTLTSLAEDYTPVLAAMTIEQNGYLVTVGDGSLEAELYRRLGVQDSIVAVLLGASEAACPAYVLPNTFGAKMQIQSPATSLITLNGSWGNGNGGRRGIRVYQGTLSATGAQAAVDLGAAGLGGGDAFLFVQASTDGGGGGGDAAIAVQHATTQGGSYSALGTFAVNGLGSFGLSFAGAVNRWVRLNVTDLGGAATLTCTLVVCVRGVTQ